jgi:hypothetical protein
VFLTGHQGREVVESSAKTEHFLRCTYLAIYKLPLVLRSN